MNWISYNKWLLKAILKVVKWHFWGQKWLFKSSKNDMKNKKLEKNDVFTSFKIIYSQRVVDIISNRLVLVLFFVVRGLSES